MSFFNLNSPVLPPVVIRSLIVSLEIKPSEFLKLILENMLSPSPVIDLRNVTGPWKLLFNILPDPPITV